MADGAHTDQVEIDFTSEEVKRQFALAVHTALQREDRDQVWLSKKTMLNTQVIRGINLGLMTLEYSLAHRIAQAFELSVDELLSLATSVDPPGGTPKPATVEGEVLLIPIDQVEPLPGQPRVYFDEEELESLAESIRKNGQRTPGEVTELYGLKKGRYQLVDGERRFRACKMAGMEYYRAYLATSSRNISDDENFRRACIANFSRSDHTPYEELMMVDRMLNQMNMRVTDVATDLSKAPVWVSHRKLIVENTVDEVVVLIREHDIPISVAKEISDLPRHRQEAACRSYIRGELKMPSLRTQAYQSRVESGRSRQSPPGKSAERTHVRFINWREQLNVMRQGLSPIAATMLKQRKGSLDDLRCFIEELEALEEYLKSRPSVE